MNPIPSPSQRTLFIDTLRMFLGLSLLPYGLSKLANLQFPQSLAFFDLAIQRLQGQSVQHLPGLSVFLLFFSYSRPYQIATGLVEIVAAVLLFWRKTWPLGAILYLLVLAYVLLVDLCYSVWLNGTLTACVLLAGVLALLSLERERFIRSIRLLLSEPVLDQPAAPTAQTTGQHKQNQRNRKWYPVQVFVIALILLVIITTLIDWFAGKFAAN